MTELTIPEEYERGFIGIRELEEELVEELISALEEESPTLSREALQRRVAQKMRSAIQPSTVDAIMQVLLSLYTLRDDMELSRADFAEVICEAMEDSYIDELQFAEEAERESFKIKLVRLLGVNSLDVAARATDLLYEHEHTIHGKPRVLTDIRPIFDTDPEASPRGAVIVHTLKITYHERRQIKEFFVALDTDSANELIEVLKRANSKAETLRRDYGDKVTYINAK